MILTDRTILITGGGSGIGRALAHAFHDAGNKVIVAGRRAAVLEETAAGRPGIARRTVDVEDSGAVKALAASVVADFPALDVLVNNAGIMRAERLLSPEEALADAEAMVMTNLLGPIRLTAALLPHLVRQRQATVINVSSGLAFVPLVMTPTYSATKAAIHSYSQSLRVQLRQTPVEVIELAPPAVATELIPGQSVNPIAMPLDAFIAETMALLAAEPSADEILVERVKPLRTAERTGDHARMFATLNRL
jgi:uncharacterized oxidoreductase